MLQLRPGHTTSSLTYILHCTVLSPSAGWNQSTSTILTNAIYGINAVSRTLSLLTNTKIYRRQKVKKVTRFSVAQPTSSDSDTRILSGHHGHHQGGGGGPSRLQGAGLDGDGRAQLSRCRGGGVWCLSHSLYGGM